MDSDSVKRKLSPSLEEQKPQKIIKPNINNDCVACFHDVSYPEGYIVPSSSSPTPAITTPAKEFNFTLDPFQAEAIKCLEKGESVMVFFFPSFFF